MLSKYVHELLYRYECVIIPEFGGILTKTESAKIDPETHTFYPPSKRLGFNSQLTENDGLLANHIASVDKIPYETALNYIKFEVEEWKSKLQKQDLNLENIGVFTLNAEGKILFEPDPNSNFLTAAFGLSTVDSHTVTRSGETEEESVYYTMSDIISEDEIAVNTTVRREISSFHKYAAAIIILLAIVGAFAIQILNLNKQEDQVAILKKDEEAKINKIIQEATFEITNKLPDITIKVRNEDGVIEYNDVLPDSVMQNNINKSRVKIKQERIDKALAQKKIKTDINAESEDTSLKVEIEENAVLSNETPIDYQEKQVASSETSTNKVENAKYHIIAGAFRETANAIKKVNQLKAKGFDAHIVGTNKWQLTQVAFASYTTKEEAQKVLNTIKSNEAKDAWLLVK